MFEVDVKNVMKKGRREGGDQLRLGVLISDIINLNGDQNEDNITSITFYVYSKTALKNSQIC